MLDKDMVRRIFVVKKDGFDVEAKGILKDLKENLGVDGLEKVSVYNRYDVSGITDKEYEAAKKIVFSERTVDDAYDEKINIDKDEKVFAVEFLPGQYDQRADSAAQCMQILTGKENVTIVSARVKYGAR